MKKEINMLYDKGRVNYLEIVNKVTHNNDTQLFQHDSTEFSFFSCIVTGDRSG